LIAETLDVDVLVVRGRPGNRFPTRFGHQFAQGDVLFEKGKGRGPARKAQAG
jgi:hypothetical protein